MKTVRETEPKSVRARISYCLTDRKKNKIIKNLKGEPEKDGEADGGNKQEDIKYENDDEEGLCFICFSNDSNCVFLDCGHGGICLDCAMDTIKRNNICALCREVVNQIIEIDPKIEIRDGLYKVLNSYYVSKEEPQETNGDEAQPTQN